MRDYDLRTFFCEPGIKEYSMQRLLLFILVVTVLIWISLLTSKVGKFPEVPASFETLIEWIGTALVFGIGAGKFVKGFGKQPEGGGNEPAAPQA